MVAISCACGRTQSKDRVTRPITSNADVPRVTLGSQRVKTKSRRTAEETQEKPNREPRWLTPPLEWIFSKRRMVA